MWQVTPCDSKSNILSKIINSNFGYYLQSNAWGSLLKSNYNISSKKVSIYSDIKLLSEKSIVKLLELLENDYYLMCSVSWGKDSLSCLILMIEAIKRYSDKYKHCPKCYVLNSNTRIENPALDEYYDEMEQSLRQYCVSNDLNIEFIQAVPDTSSSWHYCTIGRGKLPSYPGTSRTCSVDLKIKPIKKIKKQLCKNKNLVSIVGTRFEESAEREKMMRQRSDEANKLLQSDDGDLYFLPIADWTLDDVWSLISYCDTDSKNVLFNSFKPSFRETINIYRDANSGECALLSSGKSKSACAARFGCSVCMASGDRDKSLQAMIDGDSEKYDYLNGLNDFRNFLFAIRWDLSRREVLGRTYDKENNLLSIDLNYFNYQTKVDLLRYMLTLDAIEAEWANANNEGITRFELVNYQQLIEIDFAWSLYSESQNGFAAIREYYQIRHCGVRYNIPKVKVAKKAKFPTKRWLKLDLKDFEECSLMHGLYESTTIEYAKNNGINLTKLKNTFNDVEKEIVPIEVAKTMDISVVESALFVESICENPELIDLEYGASDSLYYYLSKGIVKLSAGQINSVDAILQRQQAISDIRKRINKCDLNHYLFTNSISDKEYRYIKNKIEIINI